MTEFIDNHYDIYESEIFKQLTSNMFVFKDHQLKIADKILEDSGMSAGAFSQWVNEQPDVILASLLKGNMDIIRLVYIYLLSFLNSEDEIELYIKTVAYNHLVINDYHITTLEYDLSTDETFKKLLESKLNDLVDCGFNVSDYCNVYFTVGDSFYSINYLLEVMKIKA